MSFAGGWRRCESGEADLGVCRGDAAEQRRICGSKSASPPLVGSFWVGVEAADGLSEPLQIINALRCAGALLCFRRYEQVYAVCFFVVKKLSLIFDKMLLFYMIYKNESCRKILRGLILCCFKEQNNEIFSLNFLFTNV